MSKEIILREFRPDDMDTILDISVSAWGPIYEEYSDTLGKEIFEIVFPVWQEKKRKQIEKMCSESNDGIVFIAEFNDKIVGFISFYTDSRTNMGTIGYNAVHPSYQGMGIGTKMYQFVFKQFKESGMKCATVMTGGNASHAQARKAYEKTGFSAHLSSIQYYCKL